MLEGGGTFIARIVLPPSCGPATGASATGLGLTTTKVLASSTSSGAAAPLGYVSTCVQKRKGRAGTRLRLGQITGSLDGDNKGCENC